MHPWSDVPSKQTRVRLSVTSCTTGYTGEEVAERTQRVDLMMFEGCVRSSGKVHRCCGDAGGEPHASSCWGMQLS